MKELVIIAGVFVAMIAYNFLSGFVIADVLSRYIVAMFLWQLIATVFMLMWQSKSYEAARMDNQYKSYVAIHKQLEHIRWLNRNK